MQNICKPWRKFKTVAPLIADKPALSEDFRFGAAACGSFACVGRHSFFAAGVISSAVDRNLTVCYNNEDK